VLSSVPVPAYRLPQLVLASGPGPLLRPNPLSDIVDEDVLSLNHLSGCVMQCPFCYARGYPRYRGDTVVVLHTQAAEQVRQQLQQRNSLPRAVYLCPSTDPFPPITEVQLATIRVVEVLAEFGVQAWLMTRGFIRPSILERLSRHADLVQVTLALTTPDEKLRRILEPLAAPTRMRLRQLKELRARGFEVRVSLEPLIAGLTDSRQHLVPLLDAIASAGLNQVNTAYMFVRPGIQANFEKQLGPLGLAEPILAPYQDGPILPMQRIAAARHLPRAHRQRGYALLMSLAAERGLSVQVSRLTNPDFNTPKSVSSQRDLDLRDGTGLTQTDGQAG
jgi:DNA repair photolyase